MKLVRRLICATSMCLPWIDYAHAFSSPPFGIPMNYPAENLNCDTSDIPGGFLLNCRKVPTPDARLPRIAVEATSKGGVKYIQAESDPIPFEMKWDEVKSMVDGIANDIASNYTSKPHLPEPIDKKTEKNLEKDWFKHFSDKNEYAYYWQDMWQGSNQDSISFIVVKLSFDKSLHDPAKIKEVRINVTISYNNLDQP